jgi:hypothetical protein
MEADMTEDKKAKSPFDRKFTHPERKIKTDPDQVELQKQLDKELKQTFPASDPPTVSQTTTAGAGENRKTKTP